MLPRSLLSLLLLLAAACHGEAAGPPLLSELDAADPFPSGERLSNLPLGLHALEQQRGAARILVAVHGYQSRGYEWVHLLKTLDDEDTSMWFFRWNYEGCPQPASHALVDQLRELIGENTQQVVLVGHSYGGLVLANLVTAWPLAPPVDIHIVASPLGSTRSSRCNYAPPTAVAENVRLFEWRTQWHLDGAFKDLPSDPQIIELPGSKVTRLPSEYNGHRLGHNRSLSWVADTIAKGQRAAP